jgi:hypothetical protein
MDLYQKYDWALKEEARLALRNLMGMGFEDPDLALAFLEKIWPEQSIYILDDDYEEEVK